MDDRTTELEREYARALEALEQAAYALATHLGQSAADIDPEGDASPAELDHALSHVDHERALHVGGLVQYIRDERAHLPRSWGPASYRPSSYREMAWQITRKDGAE